MQTRLRIKMRCSSHVQRGAQTRLCRRLPGSSTAQQLWPAALQRHTGGFVPGGWGHLRGGSSRAWFPLTWLARVRTGLPCFPFPQSGQGGGGPGGSTRMCGKFEKMKPRGRIRTSGLSRPNDTRTRLGSDSLPKQRTSPTDGPENRKQSAGSATRKHRGREPAAGRRAGTAPFRGTRAALVLTLRNRFRSVH